MTSSICSFTQQEVDLFRSEVVAISTASGIGWCCKEKAAAFVDLILETKPKVCVEIGVYKGASLIAIGASLKFLGEGIVIGIDPWELYHTIRYYDPIKHEPFYRAWCGEDFEGLYQTCLHYVASYGLTPFCKILRMTSIEAASHIGSIDFLHIDGDHSEQVSIQDVKLYLPKVRSGGIICYNDAIWQERGAALDLLLEACDVIQVINGADVLILRKR